jgi:hypothetical protein
MPHSFLGGKMKKQEQEALCEFGIRFEDLKEYTIELSFYLSVRYGPPIVLKKGERVWLSQATGNELFFCKKVIPSNIPEYFKVTQAFRHVKDGTYVDLQIGDILKLERQEGIKYLRAKCVTETSETEVDSNET